MMEEELYDAQFLKKDTMHLPGRAGRLFRARPRRQGLCLGRAEGVRGTGRCRVKEFALEGEYGWKAWRASRRSSCSRHIEGLHAAEMSEITTVPAQTIVRVAREMRRRRRSVQPSRSPGARCRCDRLLHLLSRRLGAQILDDVEPCVQAGQHAAWQHRCARGHGGMARKDRIEDVYGRIKAGENA